MEETNEKGEENREQNRKTRKAAQPPHNEQLAISNGRL
jgi:hypothetical protein